LTAIKRLQNILTGRPGESPAFFHFALSGCDHSLRADADKTADREGKISTIHRVEVEFLDAALDQVEHLLGRNRRSYQRMGVRVVIQPLEAARDPLRHMRAAARGKA